MPPLLSDSPRSAPAAGAIVSLLLLGMLGGALAIRKPNIPRPSASQKAPSARVLSRESFRYREHAEPERTVSSIEFRLEVRGENTAELVVEAAAVGPLVQPPRGFRYRAGENPITAREMAQLEAANRLGVVTTDSSRGFERSGEIRLGETHVFSERKIALDGTLKNIKARELPSSLRLASGELEDGDYELSIFLDGAPRLQVRFKLEDGARRGTIADVRALHPEDEQIDP